MPRAYVGRAASNLARVQARWLPSLGNMYAELIDREWSRLARSGCSWTGVQRVEIASVARRVRSEELGRPHTTPAREAGSVLPADAVEAAATISVDAASITGAWIDSLEHRGISRIAYAEILGIVSRLTAIDTFLFAIGADERPLPTGHDDPPNGVTDPDAELDGGWIPTVGPAFAHNALSAIPGEHEAKVDVSGTFYMTLEHILDLHYERDLTRPQIEFVASRTSLINDCFF